MFAADPVFSVRGIRKLEILSSDWTKTSFIRWLEKGFARLADPEQVNEWPLAFKPLVVRLDNSVMGQLAAAMTEAQRAGYAWPINLKTAIVEHLASLPLEEPATIEFATSLWRCLAILGTTGEDVALARRLLKRLPTEMSEKNADTLRQFVTALAISVAAAPIDSSNLERFFHFLRGCKPELWDAHMVIPLINAQLSVNGEEMADNWASLRSYFGDEMREVADPTTPSGRALARTLVRRLRPGWDMSDGSPTVAVMKTLLNDLGVYSPPPQDTAGFQLPESESVPNELRSDLLRHTTSVGEGS